MQRYFNRLKQNNIFKLTLVIIIVFFSFLLYFQQSKATCQCNNWVYEYDKDPDPPYGITTTATCPTGCIAPVTCGPQYYPCNRQTDEGGGVGCCKIGDIPGTPNPDPTCIETSWDACSVTCDGGVEVSNCGTVKACNEQPCCTPSCGGTECGNLAAAPNKVTDVQVNGSLSGNLDLTSSSNLNIVWIDPGTSDTFGFGVITNYVIQIWDKSQGTTPPYPCDASSNCSYYDTITKVENYTATANADHDNDVYIAVRAVNDTCVSVGYGTWSDASSYSLVADVSGNFYEDQSETPDTFNNCNSTSTTAVDLSSYTGSTVITSIGGTAGSIGTSYSLSNVPYAPSASWNDYGFDLSLAIDNSADPLNSLTCTCPVDLLDPFLCKHTTTTSPSTGQHIYLTNVDLSSGPWWQTSGGNVYGSNSFTSAIPTQCAASGLCDAYLITDNADSDTNSAGIPLTGVSSIISGGYFTQRTGTEPKALDTDHNNLIKENYAFFNRGVNLAAADTLDGTITTFPSGATPDSDNTEVYYRNGDLTVDFSSTENVASNRKIVIFVNGDLTFSSTPDTQMIDVSQGGFISFISDSDITFDPTVGNSSETDTSPNIAGVFIADGTININGYSEAPLNDDTTKDNKFVGEGTFVGWTGFNLNRDYENTTNPLQKELNNTNPIEVFVFRPDFNLNIPNIMMRPSLVWQEVN
jgi:hypothetical protein